MTVTQDYLLKSHTSSWRECIPIYAGEVLLLLEATIITRMNVGKDPGVTPRQHLVATLLAGDQTPEIQWVQRSTIILIARTSMSVVTKERG